MAISTKASNPFISRSCSVVVSLKQWAMQMTSYMSVEKLTSKSSEDESVSRQIASSAAQA